tara:strand:+ start:86 stop:367 length:282 start_codon:yes stop_codon:yes gene_type:complete
MKTKIAFTLSELKLIYSMMELIEYSDDSPLVKRNRAERIQKKIKAQYHIQIKAESKLIKSLQFINPKESKKLAKELEADKKFEKNLELYKDFI